MELLAGYRTAAGRLHYCDSVSPSVADFVSGRYWAMVATPAISIFLLTLKPTGLLYTHRRPGLFSRISSSLPIEINRDSRKVSTDLADLRCTENLSGISRMPIPRSHVGTHGIPPRWSTRSRPDSRYARVSADLVSAVIMMQSRSRKMIRTVDDQSLPSSLVDGDISTVEYVGLSCLADGNDSDYSELK